MRRFWRREWPPRLGGDYKRPATCLWLFSIAGQRLKLDPEGCNLSAVKTGFYEKNGVRLRYQEVGSGFPLLAIPGGGLNSRIVNWPNASHQHDGGGQGRLPRHHHGSAQRHQWRILWPGSGRQAVGRFRGRSTRAYGLPRHSPVLVLRQLHRRFLCAQADGAGSGSCRRGRHQPADRSPPGGPRGDGEA